VFGDSGGINPIKNTFNWEKEMDLDGLYKLYKKYNVKKAIKIKNSLIGIF
jgi:hypothetical protein